MRKIATWLLVPALLSLSSPSFGDGHGPMPHPGAIHDHRVGLHFGLPLPPDPVLGVIGAGLVAGAVIGSMFVPPYVEPPVVYVPPPPIIVRPDPVIVRSEPVIVRPAPVIERPDSYYVVPPPAPVGQPIATGIRQVTTTTPLLNIRSGPGLENEVIGQLNGGETLDVIGHSSDWLYIKTASGQYGWIMEQYTVGTREPVG